MTGRASRSASAAPRRGGARGRSTPWTVALLMAIPIALWELIARHAGIDPLLVAAPSDMVGALVRERELLLEHTWITAGEALLGITLAWLVGWAVAVLAHLAPPFGDAAYPLLIGSQSIPIVVVAPLLVIALGYGVLPKIMIVMLVCFFPVVVGTLDGLRSVDPDQLRLMRSLGAGRLRTLRLVALPASLPRMFGGVRIAASWAFIGAVFGEYAGSSKGLGYLIDRGAPTFETARVYAAVLILAVMSLALYALVAMVERISTPWARRRS